MAERRDVRGTHPMITQEMIEGLFERMRRLHAEGRVSWDIDNVCRWSYFFVDSSRDQLIASGKFLEGKGYEIVGLLEPGPEDDDQETIYLRVDRTERHSVQTLLSRNEKLYALADLLGLQGYDGMNVGVVEGP